jgi:predicted secreted protein
MSPSVSTLRRSIAAALVALLATGNAAAQSPAEVLSALQPSGVLNLNASASVEVTKDVLTVVFSHTREGTDAQAVQVALRQALDAALAEARKVAKPGQVDVQTGNFSLHPRYGAPNPKAPGQTVITGWQGSSELVVSGKEIASIAQLTGRIPTMTIGRVGYSLSKEAREKVEADVTAQAIARWRAQAEQMSRQFGYASYAVREVNVTTGESGDGPVPMMRANAMAMKMDESLPTEAGKSQVTATVSGSAQMTR